MYINDTIFIEDWSDHATRTSNERVFLSAGIKYHIVLEYYENGGIAEIHMGYQNVGASENEAVQLAADADLAVVCVGFGSTNEGEGWDRTFTLPDLQSDFIDAVTDVNKNTIVILFAGGAVQTAPWLAKAKGLIHAFYPGQYGGYALAEILFGDTNPSGKLPFSFDEEWENDPAYNDYNEPGAYDACQYSEGIFVGYRYYDTATAVEPLFPFGYGLSYTTFGYSNLSLVPDDDMNFTKVDVSFDLTNTGDRAGNEIVQLYIHDLESELVRPLKELKAFEKVWLEPSETQTVYFSVPLQSFKYYNDLLGEWYFEPGDFEILIGASSQDIRLRDTLTLTDNSVMPEAIRLFPPDDDIFVELQPEYNITFSRVMVCNGSDFEIRKYSDDSVFETISADNLTGCGTRSVSFVTALPLEPLTEYYIDIPSGYFTDDLGLNFQGFTSKDDWNFKTGTIAGPDIILNDKSVPYTIYPNPADNEFNIFFNEEVGKIQTRIANLSGVLLYTGNFDSIQEAISIDVSNFPSGIYTLSILNEAINYTEKLVVLSE